MPNVLRLMGFLVFIFPAIAHAQVAQKSDNKMFASALAR